MSETVETYYLSKTFGLFLAVDHAKIEVQEGEIFGLFGPNGVGKTTHACVRDLLLFGQGLPSFGGSNILAKTLKFSIIFAFCELEH